MHPTPQARGTRSIIFLLFNVFPSSLWHELRLLEVTAYTECCDVKGVVPLAPLYTMGRQAYLNRLALVSFTFLLANFPYIRS